MSDLEDNESVSGTVVAADQAQKWVSLLKALPFEPGKGRIKWQPVIRTSSAIMVPCSWESNLRTVVVHTKDCSCSRHRHEALPPAGSLQRPSDPFLLQEPSGEEAKFVRPILPWAEICHRSTILAEHIRQNPDLMPIDRRSSCFNCRSPDHSHRFCRWRRGTFCGTCGEPGMINKKCPWCNPELYNLPKIKK